MKSLIDTCGWIEWLTNGVLADTYATYLTAPEQLVVPTLVQHELYKWICREKGVELALEVIGITESSTVVPLDTNLALYAADMSREYQLAMADAIIYATSRKEDVLLVTSDKHFEKLPYVKFFPKKN